VFNDSYLSQVLAEKRINEETAAQTQSAVAKGHKISINFKLGCYSSNLFLVAKAKPFDFLAEFGADQVAETWASLVQAQVESSPHREAILKEVKEFQVAV